MASPGIEQQADAGAASPPPCRGGRSRRLGLSRVFGNGPPCLSPSFPKRAGPVKAPLALAATGAIAAALWAAPAAAAPCGGTPPSSLSVYGAHADAREEVRADAADLERIAHEARVTEAALRTHPLMIIAVDLRAEVAIDGRSVEAGAGVFCPAPRSVVVRFGFQRRVVYLAPEAAADACIRQTLLDHEDRHAGLDEAFLTSFLAATRGPFQAVLGRLKRTPAARAEDAAAQFDAGVKAFIGDAARRFAAERDRLHAAIDTPDEAERLRDACGGGLRVLQERLKRSQGT